MQELIAEIHFYRLFPEKWRRAKKHLIALHGIDGYELIKAQLKPINGKRAAFKAYKKTVLKLTELQPLHTLENYHLRGFENYHVDHITSIWRAFGLGWHPSQCADISNLQMLPYKENLTKGR